jgi:hypothetical protein
MNNLKIGIILFTLIALFSCNSEQKSPFKYRKYILYDYKPRNIDSTSVMSLLPLMLMDSFFIIKNDSLCNGSHCSHYNYDSKTNTIIVNDDKLQILQLDDKLQLVSKENDTLILKPIH